MPASPKVHVARACTLAGGLALVPPVAAHAPIEGMEGFWLGLRHPLTEGASCLALLALSFALAWAGWRRFRPAMAAFAGGLLAGLAVSALLDPVSLDAPLLLLAGVCAALGASHGPGAPRGPTILLPALAAATGFWLAPAQLPESGPAGDVLVTLGGSLLTVLVTPVVVLGWTDALVAAPRPAWALIAPRVLGAWLTALAGLLLALEFAPAG